jgi:hypothetical protein
MERFFLFVKKWQQNKKNPIQNQCTGQRTNKIKQMSLQFFFRWFGARNIKSHKTN